MSVPEKIYLLGPHLWGKYKCSRFSGNLHKEREQWVHGGGKKNDWEDMGLMVLYCSLEKERFNIEGSVGVELKDAIRNFESVMCNGRLSFGLGPFDQYPRAQPKGF